MDIATPLVAHPQPAEVIEPGQGALDDPAMATQPLAGVDALARDAHLDVTLAEGGAAARVVIPLVAVALVRALTPPPGRRLDRRDGVKEILQHHRVVPVSPGQDFGQRKTSALDHNMALRARFAAIRRVRADEIAPLLAGMLAESQQARLQSIWPASPSRSRSSWWSRSQTPASCQSRNLRQQVIPEPQPSSWGNISHGMPDFRTKMMPARQARSGTRGRPPLGLGGSGGSRGATIAQSSSLTRVTSVEFCKLGMAGPWTRWPPASTRAAG